ncbi:3-hydroxyacyl-CoA dehydrogenase NAD-binding domain-containing protein [Janthinobacterium sp. NKUCC08_JDC]|uniref:3-hydroxyacyl-CoA dehydrogenase NAD-binding domain-containing protein n=1 Tax=Janthinobacterium sp. NKUCC08_JDC TaxID=2842122 RepID=UPI001C5B9652|nr:3-hydroxyacyl-CoA dehydrogenase NAD-binding domain-containing protein [Janthinobacterium sp. NKUCC08_JDC]MBW3499867.1 enoyl-CoA hydratase/isomerase family protein [Janthinobacterium sp. NKUCC08_JDC]
MINTTISERIAILTIDMPGRTMNVFNAAFAQQLRLAFDAAIADEAVDAIIIASGKSSFMAGADLAQMAGFAVPDVDELAVLDGIAVYGDLFRHIETAGKPVVSAVAGVAFGAGMELLLATHYRVATPAARFALPEVKLGLLPGAGGTQRLPRLIGLVASLPLLTQGRELDGQAACKAGLVHEVVADGQLLAAARAALAAGKVDPVAPWDKKGFRLPGGDAYTPANAAAFAGANAGVQASTRGNYPAPLAILRAVYEGSKLPMAKALRLEQKLFVTLVRGLPAQNLIRTMFFAKQSADKLARRSAQVPASKVTQLGILGSGFMGAGIAQVSALSGIKVVLLDRSLEIAQASRDGIASALQDDVAKGRLSADARGLAMQRIVATADYAAFADCDLVIEAVIEDEQVKEQVIRAAEAAMGEHAIFASNTSALPIDDLARFSVRPRNFIGLHYFSPVPKMALVEVIVGKDTSDETLARALDYIRQIRKTPIVVNDGYGFYTTRCVDAYIREGIRLLADGVDPVRIENAGVALGMPVGPLALADEVGLDVLHHIAHFFRSREDGDWADDRHQRVNAIIDAQTLAQRYGRKKGAGFYAYPASEPKHLDLATLAALADRLGEAGQPSPDAIRERLLYAQLLEAARCWADGVAQDAGEIDLGAILGWAFPSYLGGPASAIDAIGPARFVARLQQLAAAHGPRFTPPGRLVAAAADNFHFHG